MLFWRISCSNGPKFTQICSFLPIPPACPAFLRYAMSVQSQHKRHPKTMTSWPFMRVNSFIWTRKLLRFHCQKDTHPRWASLNIHSFFPDESFKMTIENKQLFSNVRNKTNQLTLSCTQSTKKTLEKGVKYVQS